MNTAATESVSMQAETPLQLFAAYPFDADEAYQQGLASIIAGATADDKSTEDLGDLIRRSQVFYFNHITGHSISTEDVRAYEASLSTSGPPPSSLPMPSAPVATTVAPASSSEVTTLTFAQLRELIEQGRTDEIPNNRHIPDVLNDAPPSQSTAMARKKPWELSTE